MKTISVTLGLALGLAFLPLAGEACAAQPAIDMQAALDQMVAAQDLEFDSASVDKRFSEGVAILKRTGAELIAANTDWNDAQRSRAQAILEELAPQVFASMDAGRQQLLRDIGPEMIREGYPKYFSAAEISELAAYYASPAYKKMRPIASDVELELRMSGGDRQTLWKVFSGGALSDEEVRYLHAFRISELGQKLVATIPLLFRDWGQLWDSRVRSVIDAAVSGYRQEFARRMAAAEKE